MTANFTNPIELTTMESIMRVVDELPPMPPGPIEIHTSELLATQEQFRFPRSRKRRIRAKWAKRPENFRTVPLDAVFRMGNKYVMHPALRDALEREILAGLRETPSVIGE